MFAESRLALPRDGRHLRGFAGDLWVCAALKNIRRIKSAKSRASEVALRTRCGSIGHPRAVFENWAVCDLTLDSADIFFTGSIRH